MFGRREGYDYIEQHSDLDPTEVITGGTSSHDFAQDAAGTYTLVCEVPYYYDPRIEDVTVTDRIRRNVVLEGLETGRALQHQLETMYRAVEPLLTQQSPFREAVGEAVANLEAKASWAKTDPELQRSATEAEIFDNMVGPRFYRLLMLGMYLRLLGVETAYGGSRDRLRGLAAAAEDAEAFFRQWHDDTLSELNYQVIPIQKLVWVQLGSALYTARAIEEDLADPADPR